MVSSKDLRNIFDEWRSEASKRAGHAMNDLRDVNIERHPGTPGLVWLGLGLVIGAGIGIVAAILSTPYKGEEARAKLAERVEKMKTQREEAVGQHSNGNGSSYTAPIAVHDR